VRVDFSRHAPPGLDLKPETRLFGWGLVLSALFSLQFFARFADAREKLYWKNGPWRELIEGAVMPDFAQLLGPSLAGFWVLAACLAALIVVHYAYHYHASRSIYLMRRLPSRWELHRRCLTLPLAGVVLCLAAAFVALVVFYLVYMTFTPDICLAPGQWQKIWSVQP
jgi:hypothetical protein